MTLTLPGSPPQRIEPLELPCRYQLPEPSLHASGVHKRELLQRASEAATRFDSRIVRVEASFTEEIREILVVNSEGQQVADAQPLLRFGVRAIAEHGPRRESGRSGGGAARAVGPAPGPLPQPLTGPTKGR